MLEYYEKLNDLLKSNTPFVAVEIVDTVGSVPQNAGHKMLVTDSGLRYGTVGGGKVESRAICEAQDLLRGESGLTGEGKTRFVNWSLDRDIGMTCGGSVKLYFEIFNTNCWNIAVFGAGHCANALIGILIGLDCRVTCFDTRQEWLDRLPDSSRLTKVEAEDLPGQVAKLHEDAYVVLMTMGHTTDKPILLRILSEWDERSFPYLGVIGSKAKAARLYKDIEEAGFPQEYRELFHCPMGLPIGNNHPQEIAISIVAQLLQTRDREGCTDREK